MIRYFKYAVLIAVVLGAIVTPSPDAWNQLILAGTIVALYAASIGIVAVFGKRAQTSSVNALMFPAGWWLWRRRDERSSSRSAANGKDPAGEISR